MEGEALDMGDNEFDFDGSEGEEGEGQQDFRAFNQNRDMQGLDDNQDDSQDDVSFLLFCFTSLRQHLNFIIEK